MNNPQNPNPFARPQLPATNIPPAPAGEEPKQTQIHDPKDIRWLRLALSIALSLIVCIIAWILITEGSAIIARLGNHIMRLFDSASLNPHNYRGFARFVQLILIAVFVGWAINRFKNK